MGKLAMILTAVLFGCLPAAAQVTVGDNLNLNLAGDLAVGYNGGFGDPATSSHGINLGGDARLNGYFYNPKFISFRFQPYYNRSQSNSSFQSLNNSSGFSGNVDFFSGSHFPGSISYSKEYESSGEFGVPGTSGLTTHGNGQSIGISWSALLPHLPTVNVNYSINDGSSEVFGAQAASQSSSRNFNLQANHSLAGFRLYGSYNRQSQEASFPALQTGQPAIESNNGSSSESLQASHAIPLNGQWSVGWTHSSYDGTSLSGSQTGSTNGTTDGLNTGVSLNPVRKLSLSLTTTYNTNLYGSLQQLILQAGGNASQRVLEYSASGLTLNGSAFYTLTSHIALNGHWSHQEQYFDEGNRGVTQYGGGVNFNYSHKFLGALTFGVGAVDTATQQGNRGAGLVSNVNFSRRLHGWDVGANLSYAQDVQTLLATYTTSSYGYTTSIRRKFGNGMHWSSNFHGSHSALAHVAGSSNHAEGFSSALSFGRYSVTGNYSQSGGISILTAQGLVAIPTGVPAPLLPHQILYNARSLGFGGSAVVKRWALSVAYSNANSDTVGPTSQMFETRLLNARLDYRLRKMYLRAGFTHFVQSLGGSAMPTEVNSYYFGISRWFNVF